MRESLQVRGAMGGAYRPQIGVPWGLGLGEYTWERLVRSPTQRSTVLLEDLHETNDETNYETIARNIARIGRNITNITRCTGICWNISNTIGKTVGNVS